MLKSNVLLAALLSQAAAHAIGPPGCTNLTGWWCCEETNLTQVGAALYTTADYGDGNGTISGYSVAVSFSNAPEVLTGVVNAACNAITWSNGATWTRSAPPWPGPAVPPPAYTSTLSAIYELNPRTYTSPNGTGDGDGSGTFASLALQMPYLSDLGIDSIWCAGAGLATSHFYGIWSVYAANRPDIIDPVLGTPEDFTAFVEAAHAVGVRVYLDVIGHGLVNESSIVADHPDWFSGSSWGMRDFDYSNVEFQAWWISVWLKWAVESGIDGARIDIADPSWWPVWDNITTAAAAAGVQLLVFGEGSRYHFSQHDVTGGTTDMVARVQQTPTLCFETVQLSCHDSGWESGPGNYFAVRGSRSLIGYSAILSPYIPLFLGGEEYNEDPVADLPLLQQDLYGQSGKPGGWMYGSVRQLDQVNTNSTKAAMLSDVRQLFRIVKEHADVLHRDKCSTNITRVPYSGASLSMMPYVRFTFGWKAVVVVGSDSLQPLDITLAVPLEVLGFGTTANFMVETLYPTPAGPPTVPASAQQLAAWPVTVSGDYQAQGGLVVLLITPAA